MNEPRHRAEGSPPVERVRALQAAAVLAVDARNRALRTFLQGLAITVSTAVVLVLAPIFATAKSWDDFDWSLIGFSLFQAAGAAVLSWVMRKYLDRSKVPTPLPPDDAA